MYKQKRSVPKNTTDISIQSVHNKFEVEIKDVFTGEKNKYLAENVVTNCAWRDYIFKSEVLMLRVGESSEPEDPSQTNLLIPFVSKTQTGSPKYERYTKNGNARTTTYFFGVNDNNGKIFAELGLVNSSSSRTVFNRSTLKDINGNPITITKTDLIEITIYATVYVTIDLQPWQSVMSSSSLFNLIKNGNQDLYVTTPTTYGPVNGEYSYTYGKLQKSSPRIAPADKNGGVTSVQSFGLEHNLFRSPTMYDINQRQLGTGDGTNTMFYCGYCMKELEIYKNGILVPSSEYTTNLFAYNHNTYKGTTASSMMIYMENSYGNRVFTNHSITGYDFSIAVPDYLEGQIDAVIAKTPNGKVYLECSHDNKDWVEVKSIQTPGNWDTWSISVPEIKPYKYIRTKGMRGPDYQQFLGLATLNAGQIRFNNPPESGAVLTYSGKTPCIPKDSNYVLELSSTLTYSCPPLE